LRGHPPTQSHKLIIDSHKLIIDESRAAGVASRSTKIVAGTPILWHGETHN